MADNSSKHEIMKKLLSAPNPPPQIRDSIIKRMDKTMSDDSDNDSAKLYNYLERITDQVWLDQEADELNVIEMDHTYSLPWNWGPDNCHAKPVKNLFVTRTPTNSVSWGTFDGFDTADDSTFPKPAYDSSKAHMIMDETSRLITMLRNDPGDPEWETNINKSDWGMSQVKLFDKVTKILNNEHLSRLTYKRNWNEPVLRRISLDKSARRFRSLMATISWKPRLIQWLHNVLLENLDVPNLIAYIDILQTLNKKIPSLIERLTSGPAGPRINPDALNMLLKKPWDPATTALTSFKTRRLPGNPLIVVVPCGTTTTIEKSRRMQRWLPLLSQIGHVVPVNANVSHKVTIMSSLEYMLTATRAKLAELRSDFMGKQIVLFGLNSGAALACQVSLIERVSCVICIGFPVNTCEDKRGEPDDNLLNLSVPTLFVVGQQAATSYIDDIEEIRGKLRVETGLVFVGGADDQLRVNKNKLRTEGITQSMVDRCIMDEVADFIGSMFSSPQSARSVNRPRFKLVEKKRKISIQEDYYPKRQFVHTVSPRPGGITLNVTTTSRRGHSGRGRGRSKYVTQTGSGIAISRGRGGMSDKGIVRPSIENISVINPSNLDHAALTGESSSYKIVPQIKVLGSEEFSSSKIQGSDNSLIDQLTPDRLLEMPVIIAPDNHEDNQESPLKVVMSGPKGLKESSSTTDLTLNQLAQNKRDLQCATIYVRKRGMSPYHGTRVSTINVNNRQVRKPRLQHFPATEYTNETQ